MRGSAVKEMRRKSAEERQEEFDKLTIEQKIDKLDKMFGKGKGAKKERAKLQTKLESEKSKKKSKKVDKK